MDQSKTAADRVYEEMRRMILTGKLQPGEKLVQRKLAAHFKTSNIPVVEALRRLERDGLVTHESRWGASVKTWSKEDIETIYLLREALEGLACRLFAERATPMNKAVLIELARAIDLYAAEGKMELCNEADLEFHSYIVRNTGSPTLISFLENFSVITITLLNSVWYPTRPEDYASGTVGTHNPIVAAVQSGDPEAAERAARDHLRLTRERFRRKIEEMGDGQNTAGRAW